MGKILLNSSWWQKTRWTRGVICIYLYMFVRTAEVIFFNCNITSSPRTDEDSMKMIFSVRLVYTNLILVVMNYEFFHSKFFFCRTSSGKQGIQFFSAILTQSMKSKMVLYSVGDIRIEVKCSRSNVVLFSRIMKISFFLLSQTATHSDFLQINAMCFTLMSH